MHRHTHLLPARCGQGHLQRGRLLRLGTIASWLRRKHRIGWPALKRRFCVNGWRFAADGVTFTAAASVAVTRYRYRGYRMPTLWTPKPAAVTG
jgi:hypothetical protein